MLDTTLIKTLLHHEFYNEHRTNLTDKLFKGDTKDLFRALKKGHESYRKNLSTEDLKALWITDNPIATRAETSEIDSLIGSVDRSPELTFEVAADLVRELHMRSLGLKFSNLGIELTEGRPDALADIEALVKDVKNGVLPNEYGEPTTKDLPTLLALGSDENRYRFNIRTLSRNLYGLGKKEFMAVFALPETGKSAFAVSILCGPQGFCEQGAKCLYLGNEEDTSRTMLRAMQCHAGMSKEEVIAEPEKCKNMFSHISENLEMRDIQDWDINKIEGYIEKTDVDVVVIDQADKVHISGKSFNSSHEKLRELYRRLRELAKRQSVALIVVSQASNEARGRTRLSGFDMEGSKIGKMAELDVCIGIGKQESGEIDDSEIDYTRYLTVSKNKLSGWHGTVICNLEPQISRYVE